MTSWTLQYGTEIVDGPTYKVYSKHLTDNFNGLKSDIDDRLSKITASAQSVSGAVTWNASQTYSATSTFNNTANFTSRVNIATASDPASLGNGDMWYNTTSKDLKLQHDGQLVVIMPTGMIFPFAGANAPSGFLLCYGQAVSRTTYAALYTLLSTTYGSGDGSTTFNVPDLRGRTIIGIDNMGGSAASRVTSASVNGSNSTALGGAGGAETHTLTNAQLPSFLASPAVAVSSGTSGFTGGAGTGFSNGSSSVAITNGSGQAHSNTQPWMALNYIIKV